MLNSKQRIKSKARNEVKQLLYCYQKKYLSIEVRLIYFNFDWQELSENDWPWNVVSGSKHCKIWCQVGHNSKWRWVKYNNKLVKITLKSLLGKEQKTHVTWRELRNNVATTIYPRALMFVFLLSLK